MSPIGPETEEARPTEKPRGINDGDFASDMNEGSFTSSLGRRCALNPFVGGPRFDLFDCFCSIYEIANAS